MRRVITSTIVIVACYIATLCFLGLSSALMHIAHGECPHGSLDLDYLASMICTCVLIAMAAFLPSVLKLVEE